MLLEDCIVNVSNGWFYRKETTETRMHSSGMRTARLLTVSQHALWQGGVPARGVYLPGGCTYLGVYLPRWYLPRGCTCLGVVPAQWGVPAWGSVFTCPGGVPAQVPPHGQTYKCKNITFANTGGNNDAVKTQRAFPCEVTPMVLI